MKKFFDKIKNKANSKIIIAVVVGAVILGGLYALFDNVILPTLETRIDGMFDYAG